MRNKSSLVKKTLTYLKKALDLFNRGRVQALNFQVNGVRFLGKDLKNLAISEKDVKFFVGDNHHTLYFSNLKGFKRLRTKKYVFIFDSAKEVSQKVEEKAPEESEESEEETEEIADRPEQEETPKKAVKKKTTKKKVTKKGA